MTPRAKGQASPGAKAIDELMFKTRKKWERRKKALKRAEARAATRPTRARSNATIDSSSSRMKKLEADMDFLRDERGSLESTPLDDKTKKMKKSEK